MVPFDTRSPMITSGIRVGTPAVTTRGMKEAEMQQIVAWIDEAIIHQDDEQQLANIRKEVNKLMDNFPLFTWS